MAFSAYFKKAALAVRLFLGRNVTLGDKTYRMKAPFINHLALKDGTKLTEPWLDAVYQTVLRCREGAFLDIGANIGQTMLKILSLDPSRQYMGFKP